MTLMERINLERILDALAEQYEDGRGLSHCMYCGRGDCRHAPEWASRAWSSDCAAMQAVVPSYAQPTTMPSVVQAIADGAYHVTR